MSTLNTETDNNYVSNCAIIPRQPTNSSDHLPIRVELLIKVCHNKLDNSKAKQHRHVPPNWGAYQKICAYNDSLKQKLDSICYLDISQCDNISDKQTKIDKYVDLINNAMHDAAKDAGCVPKHVYSPKSYWCPELGNLRNRKTFWWNIWTQNGRPRQGAVWECWKGIKKMFRRTQRICINNQRQTKYNKLNAFYRSKNFNAFWKALNKKKSRSSDSPILAQKLADHFKLVSSDSHNQPLSDEQIDISESVDDLFSSCTDRLFDANIPYGQISILIDSLKRGTSAGPDGITPEHLVHGKSQELCSHLAVAYSACLSHGIVPSVVKLGTVIPLLKKPSLDPSDPSNYRPITVSSMHSKLIELSIIPVQEISDTQFAYRPGRGANFAVTLVHDVSQIFVQNGSPVYIATLDAEKCFDSVWHKGIFDKLKDALPLSQWRFLYKWYSQLQARVKFNGEVSDIYSIYRGTRQGGILSPIIFNIFLNDLLIELKSAQHGVRLGNMLFNSVAYADDVSLISATATGLQVLLDICGKYADKWRMRFNVTKSNCMVIGKNILQQVPTFSICSEEMKIVNSVNLLGVNINSKCDAQIHVDNRVRKCRMSYYGLGNSGMAYPGLATDVKSHLWRTICDPVLSYGIDCISLGKKHWDCLQSLQGQCIKKCMGLSKRSRHSNLLKALSITNIAVTCKNNSISLLKRIMSINTPTNDLCDYLIERYYTHKTLYPKTLVGRVIQMGISPLELICDRTVSSRANSASDDGHIDSLRYLVSEENYIKPWSAEYKLVQLLTRSF